MTSSIAPTRTHFESCQVGLRKVRLRTQGMKVWKDFGKSHKTKILVLVYFYNKQNCRPFTIVIKFVKSGSLSTSKSFKLFHAALNRASEEVQTALASEDAVSYLNQDYSISLRFIKKATSITVYIHSTQAAKSWRVRARFFFGQKMDVSNLFLIRNKSSTFLRIPKPINNWRSQCYPPWERTSKAMKVYRLDIIPSRNFHGILPFILSAAFFYIW